MQIRLEDVLKTSWKTKSVTLKTSSRRLEDVLENKKCLLGAQNLMRAFDILINHFLLFPIKLLEKENVINCFESAELQVIKIQLKIEFCSQIE